MTTIDQPARQRASSWAGVAIAVALASGTIALPASAVTYDVPGGFPTIQDAIDVCIDGDVVMVADGVYSGPGNFDLDLGGRLITVMSANGPDLCAIDCLQMGRAFSFQTGETADAIVSGFTIRNGLVIDDGGGAISMAGASPTVRNCHFEDNTAYSAAGGFPTGSGGAIFSSGGSPSIEDCEFTGNTAGFAASPPGTGFGGAIFMFLGGGSVTGSTFDGNLADGPGGFGNGIGGGMFVLFASPDLDGCAFTDNHAVIAGGGVWLQGTATTDVGFCTFDSNTAQSGGGLAVFEGEATVHDSTFTGNSVASADPIVQQRIGGGAIGCADTVTVTIDRCTFLGNVSMDGVGGAVSTVGGSTATIANSAFGENDAFLTGGAVHNGAIPGSGDPDLELPSTTTMINCLVACNRTDGMGAGASNGDGGTMAMVNCTVAHNAAGGGGGGLANMMPGSTTAADNCIFYQNRSEVSPHVSQILDGPGGVIVNDSIVQKGWDGAGSNILRKNPKFVDATPSGGFADNDYHLRFDSPAIDAGNDGVVTVIFDLDGNDRIVGAAVDIGTYESQ